MIKQIHNWEKAVVTLLNLDGWDLKHSGEGSESWDAVGKTPKGEDCVIEIKYRNKYYDTKIIEKFKYDKLFSKRPQRKLYVLAEQLKGIRNKKYVLPRYYSLD